MMAWLQTILLLVVVAAGLRGADALSQWLTGLPRGAVTANDLAQACRISGLALRLPPAVTARYRPREVVALPPPAAGLRITMNAVSGGHDFSLFRLTTAKRAQALLSPLPVFNEIRVQVAGRPAQLRALRTPEGTVMQELEWQGGLRSLVRFQGPTLELLSLAEQLAPEMP